MTMHCCNAVMLCYMPYSTPQQCSAACVACIAALRGITPAVSEEVLLSIEAANGVSGTPDPQSRWLMAQCCMSMNKLTEAEHALNPNNDGTEVCSS